MCIRDSYKSPVELCKSFSDRQMLDIVKHLSVIDCFTSHYGFDDKVVKFAKEEYTQKGYKFYDADSFAEIHTAANNSWYRFRKVCQTEENPVSYTHLDVYKRQGITFCSIPPVPGSMTAAR